MNYRLTQDIPGMGRKGDKFESFSGEITYICGTTCTAIYPHEIALMLHAGLLEEVKEAKIELWEEMPPHKTEYWYLDDGEACIYDSEVWYSSITDKIRLKLNNLHKTKESAEEALRIIMES